MAKPVSRLFHPAPFGEGEDPDAAPGASKGPCVAPPWTWRRGRQNLLWVYLGGLIFLVFPIVEQAGRVGIRDQVVGGTFIAAIAVMYALTAWVSDSHLWARRGYLASFLVVVLSGASVWGWDAASYGVYVAIMMATLIPWRHARWLIGSWGVLLLTAGAASQTWMPVYIGVLALGIGFATGGGIEAGRVSSKLSRVEQRVSVLAVAAERERIGRDLHDILGHSLTAIAIKSSLAARLVEQDPKAARQQLAEIEEVSRQALADVRATASGFREIRVATEIASARSVLMAAGIEASVPTALPPMSDEHSELFGYVVREAITNVVRHSEATTCVITVSPDEVAITDDGHGFHDRGNGSGLAGLAERVGAGGAVFEVESHVDVGTTVRARLDPAVRRTDAPADSLARR
ncbi:MAG TPA: sensor histidine kinase [Propionibacteriaceae bacterium]